MTSLIVSNALLWLVVVALVTALLAAVRQIGVLHERIGPTGALMLAKGLTPGEPAPQVSAQDLQGVNHVIGAPRMDGRATLVMFVSPTCPVCKSLLPILKSSRDTESDWLHMLIASDGEEPAQRTYFGEQRLEMFPYVLSNALGLAYQVSRLPFAVLLDERGVIRARGIVNSREHLESLFEAKRLGFATLQDYFESKSQLRAA